jgi:hypothetical protein
MSNGSALNTTACSNLSCHGPVASFDVNGNNRRGTLSTLLAALDTALAGAGVVKASPFDYPFFTNITTAVQLRATFNYIYVYNDPAAYVHNWRYAAQLLYDSLDQLDDGLLNGSVTVPGVNKAQFGR